MIENERHPQKRSAWQEGMNMIKRHPFVSVLVVVLAIGGLATVFLLMPSLATSSATKDKAKNEKKEKEEKETSS